jgi:2-iminobutanoate/2-iminopropanoate deaminase
MSLSFIATDSAPRAIGPYSQAVVANGLVYCAGQIAFNPQTMEIVHGGIREQTERVMENLRAVLQSAGSDLSKVLKTTVFLVDMADFTAMNEVYAHAFGTHKPARSTVAVAGLPRGVRVEIDAVATV